MTLITIYYYLLHFIMENLNRKLFSFANVSTLIQRVYVDLALCARWVRITNCFSFIANRLFSPGLFNGICTEHAVNKIHHHDNWR